METKNTLFYERMASGLNLTLTAVHRILNVYRLFSQIGCFGAYNDRLGGSTNRSLPETPMVPLKLEALQATKA